MKIKLSKIDSFALDTRNISVLMYILKNIPKRYLKLISQKLSKKNKPTGAHFIQQTINSNFFR